AGDHGTVSPSNAVSVNHGASQSFTITPATGYHLATLLVDSAPVATATTYTFTSVTANHTLTASFAISSYTITTSADANGSITPSGAVSVSHGAAQAFTITPNPCYHIADVLVDGVSVGAVSSYSFSNVIADHAITANFAANPLPAAVTGLTAQQMISGNDNDGDRKSVV